MADSPTDQPTYQKVKLLLAVCLLAASGVIIYYKFSPRRTNAMPPPDDFQPMQVVRPFAPITDAPFIGANEVADQVSDEELVLGVAIDDAARAYPINMLCGPSREIINDTLGNRAIAATW